MTKQKMSKYNKLTKTVSIVTSICTILWLSGVAMLAPIPVRHAQADIIEGDLIRAEGTFDIYIVKLVGDKSFKRLILNPDIFNQYGHLEWGNVQDVAQSVVDSYTTSDLTRAVDDPKVYKTSSDPDADTGIKQWLNMTAAQFESEGYDWDSIYLTNTFERDSYADGGEIVVDGEEPGTLTVTLNADNPAAGYKSTESSATYPGEALSTLLILDFAASSDGDVKVTDLNITRSGLSSDSDFSTVYLYDGKSRLSLNTSISSNVINFHDANGLFTVSAGETKVITIKVDFSKTASTGTVYLKIALASDITSDATSVTIGDLTGNIMSLMNTSNFGRVTTATTTEPATTVDAETTDFNALKFRITMTNQIGEVEYLRFKNIGSIDADSLQNFRVFVSGVQHGDAIEILDDNSELIFDFSDDPISISKGSYKNIDLRADVIKGSTKTFKFTIQRQSDIVIKDVGHSVYVAPQTTWFILQPASATTINEGTVIVKKSDNSPTGNVTTKALGVPLAKFDFKASGEDIKVTLVNIDITVATTTGGCETSTPGQVLNGGLFMDDVQVGNTQTIATPTVDFDIPNGFIIPAGETKVLEVRADIDSDAHVRDFTDYDTIVIQLASFDAQAQSSLATKDATEDDNGNTLTVRTGALTLSKYTAYGNQTLTKGSSDAKIGSFVLEAGVSEGVSVYTITVALDHGSSGTTDLDANSTPTISEITNLYLKDGDGTQLGTTKSSPTASNAISVSFDLAANETKIINVYADLSSDMSTADLFHITMTSDGTRAITGTTASASATAGQSITIAAGTVTAAVAADNPVSAIITANTDDFVISKYTFSAVYEAFTVSEVKVQVASGTDDDFAEVWLSYTDENGDTITTSKKNLSAEVALWTGLTMYVPANEDADLTVYAKMNAVSVTAADSGDQPRLGLFYYKANSASVAVYEGGPDATNYDQNLTTNGLRGEAMLLYKTVPTVALNGGSSGDLAIGDNWLYQVDVTADSQGDVKWKRMTFYISNATATIDTLKFFKGSTDKTSLVTILDHNGNSLEGTSFNIAVNATATVTVTWDGTTEETVAKGITTTYKLKANVTDIVTNSYVQTYLKDDTSAPTVGTYTSHGYNKSAATGTNKYFDTDNDASVTAGDIRHSAWKMLNATVTDSEDVTSTNASITLSGFDLSTNYNNATIAIALLGAVTSTETMTGTVSTSFGTGATGTITFGGSAYDLSTNGWVGSIQFATAPTGWGLETTNTVTIQLNVASSSSAVVATNTDIGNTGYNVMGDADIGLSIPTIDYHFIWSDKHRVSHAYTTADWTTAYLVVDLPTDAYTLSY